MKTILIAALFSLFWTKASDNGIGYRQLAWEDFRGTVPDNEPMIAARTCTQLALEIRENEGAYHFHVTAYFLPDSSFVRTKTDEVLRHEQTHFQIAYIKARECAAALRTLEGHAGCRPAAVKIYVDYTEASGSLNDQFDLETNNGLNKEAEKKWENRIKQKINTLANGRVQN
jgi:hypothetical protein